MELTLTTTCRRDARSRSGIVQAHLPAGTWAVAARAGSLAALLVIAVAASARVACAQATAVSLSGTSYTQNFDGITTGQTSSISAAAPGWSFWRSGTSSVQPNYALSGSNTTAVTQNAGTTGTGVVTSSSPGGAYLWVSGTLATGTDKSIGYLSTGAYPGTTTTAPGQTLAILFGFTNTTGATITTLDLAWNYERYRQGSRTQSWEFYSSTDGSTWSANSLGDTTYTGSNTTTVYNPPESTAKAVSIPSLSIANGSSYYLRWSLVSSGSWSNGQGLGIDDFTMTVVAPKALVWNTTDGTWNTSTTNWTTGTGGALSFVNGDTTTFSGTGGGTVTLSGSLAPSAVTVSATAGTYTFASSAGNQITGTTGLAKSGAGTLVLAGPNTYSGTTALTAGTLRAGDGAAFGTGTLALGGGTLSSDGSTARSFSNAVVVGGDVALGDATATGALTFSGGVDLGGATRTLTTVADTTLSGVVANGGLTKAGAGTLTLTSASPFTGSTDVFAGTLALSGAGGIGSSDIIAIEAGATLDVSAVTGGWQLGGGQTLTGDGTLVGPATAAVGSTVYPGGVSGTLTATGGFTLLGLLDLDVNGSTISLLDASAGGLTLGGSVNFNVLSAPTANLVFATYQSLAGTFGSVTGLPTGYTIDYAYLGNQIALVPSNPGGVPEIDPAGLAGVLALLGGALGIVERRRTRRSQA